MRVILLALLVAACPAGAQEAPSPEKQRVLDALTELAEAVDAWTAAARSGEDDVTPEDLADVEVAGRGLNRAMSELSAFVVGAPEPTRRDVPTVTIDPQRYEAWAAALLAVDAPEASAAARTEIGAALVGDDESAAFTAIRALLAAHGVTLDRSAFRAPLLRWLDVGQGPTRVAAAYALNLDRRPDDLERIVALTTSDDPAVRAAASHLLLLFSDGVITGDAETVLVGLLEERDPGLMRETLRGLWGATLSREVQERLVALEVEAIARGDRPLRHDVVYFALSTLPNKTRPVVDRLLEATTDTDSNVAGRALWGLGHGVVLAADGERIAEAMVRLHNARVDPQVREACRDLVGHHGTQEQLDALN